MKIHKLAKYFPVLEGEEFDLFVQDIKEHGQREPIVMVGDEILDGVNRWKVCEQLGIGPLTEQYQGDDPLAYVISLNIRRRHLTESQRGMLATEMQKEIEEKVKQDSPDLHGDHKGETLRTAKILADKFGVEKSTIGRAQRIKKQAPERVENIIKGKESVRAVDSELRQARAAERATAQKEKQTQKAVKQEHHGVSKYFDALLTFKNQLQLTVEGSKREQWFAPESINIVLSKHNEIRELMEVLEESI